MEKEITSGTEDREILGKLLRVDTVAALLDVSIRHVWRLADSGRMPRPVKLGGARRWRAEEIKDWIGKGCNPVG
jgi:excisionase family DNA binding protein